MSWADGCVAVCLFVCLYKRKKCLHSFENYIYSWQKQTDIILAKMLIFFSIVAEMFIKQRVRADNQKWKKSVLHDSVTAVWGTPVQFLMSPEIFLWHLTLVIFRYDDKTEGQSKKALNRDLGLQSTPEISLKAYANACIQGNTWRHSTQPCPAYVEQCQLQQDIW